MPDTTITKDRPDDTSSTPILKRFSKKTIIIASVSVVLGIVVILSVILSKNEKSSSSQSPIGQQINQNQSAQNHPGQQANQQSTKETLNTVIYGAWDGKQSVIKSIDLLTGDSKQVAALPLNIKKVSIVSPRQLIYIDETNTQDHGKKIKRFGIKNKASEALFTADSGYGIDDYILSPNKRFMAVWEVALASNSQVLYGGKSRVYTVDLDSPKTRHILYDEKADNLVHYPRAILNDGKVFTDKFMPNDPNGGVGWSYGIGVSDFEGSKKEDLSQMENGTYGTKPSLSPDGKYLVFAGYDGSKGDGKAVKDGYRQAVLAPNTVELLDTNTFSRTKLPNLSNNSIYTSVDWDRTNGNLILTMIPSDPEKTGLYTYNVSSKTIKPINLPENDQTYYSYISTLSDKKILIGKADDSQSSLGNLGENYAPSLTDIYSFDQSTNTASTLPHENVYIQYISTLPQNYFTDVLAAVSPGVSPLPQPTFIDLYSGKNDIKRNLQLYTFLLKQDLTKTRETQQSNPVPRVTPKLSAGPTNSPRVFPTRQPFVIPETINCRELADAQCPKGWNHAKCRERVRADLKAQGKCNQSPLYLYGNPGSRVNVQVLTPVQNAIPAYNNGYDVTLGVNGKLQVEGQIYNSLTYDYTSNLRRIQKPLKGTFAKKAEVEKILKDYAAKLGLNTKETSDLINSAKQKLDSPYIFISFFDQKTSEQILPLEFEPAPDNYLNVVFYFKELDEEPTFTPVPPVFPDKLDRSGFTAVEISEIVE